MSAQEFYELTPVEFFIALEIVNKKEEQQVQTLMEAARFITLHIWNAAGRQMKRVENNPSKLFPFPWDKDTNSGKRKQSVEEIWATMKGIASMQNRYVNQQQKRKKRENKPDKTQGNE